MNFTVLSKLNISLYTLIRLSLQGGGAMDDVYDKYQDFNVAQEELSEISRLYSVVIDINKVYLWVLLVVGLPANILTLVTVLTMQVINSTSLLIGLLAAIDGAALIGKLIASQIASRQLYLGTVGCKMEFLILFLSTAANWMLAFICLERNICQWYPEFKAKFINKKSVSGVVATFLGILFVIFGAIVITMRDSVKSGYQCGVYIDYYWFYKNVWFWINAALFLFIPCSIIFPCVVMTIIQVVLSRKRDGKDVSISVTAGREQRYENSLTIMIMVASVCIIILCLPACIYYLTYEKNEYIILEARWAVFEQIQFLMLDSTHAIKFFVYLLSSAAFRQQVIYILSCKKYGGNEACEYQDISLQAKNNEENMLLEAK